MRTGGTILSLSSRYKKRTEKTNKADITDKADRERDRQTEIERQTDRQTVIKTERQRDRERETER